MCVNQGGVPVQALHLVVEEGASCGALLDQGVVLGQGVGRSHGLAVRNRHDVWVVQDGVGREGRETSRSLLLQAPLDQG